MDAIRIINNSKIYSKIKKSLIEIFFTITGCDSCASNCTNCVGSCTGGCNSGCTGSCASCTGCLVCTGHCNACTGCHGCYGHCVSCDNCASCRACQAIIICGFVVDELPCITGFHSSSCLRCNDSCRSCDSCNTCTSCQTCNSQCYSNN